MLRSITRYRPTCFAHFREGWNWGDSLTRLAKEKNYDVVLSNINQIQYTPNNGWILYSGAREVARSAKLVLSGGGIGNLMLLQGLHSRNKLTTFDHVPLKVYCFQFRANERLADFTGDSSPVRLVLKGEQHIMSLYGISSLSTDFRAKIPSAHLATNVLPACVVSRLFFAQVWLEDLTYEISLSGTVGYRQNIRWSLLRAAIKQLKELGLVPLFFNITKPGEGFHYIGLSDSKKRSTSAILKEIYAEYDGTLTILGGLSLAETVLENPTLIFMADAYAKAKSNI